MTTIRVENLPATWDDARDGAFFRITATLFAADFCLGAGVLLASYDPDTSSGEASLAATAQSSTDHTQTPPAPELISVRVRRPR